VRHQACGWAPNFQEELLEHRLQKSAHGCLSLWVGVGSADVRYRLEARGERERAAALALFHQNVERAVQSLRGVPDAGSSEPASAQAVSPILLSVAMALAGCSCPLSGMLPIGRALLQSDLCDAAGAQPHRI
jgi:hypothetical protein